MQSLVLAFITLGLALQAILWSVPAVVTASAVAGRRPTEAASPRLAEALTNLLTAETEALRVAGVALEQPSTPGLGARADRAGAAVLTTARAYVDTFTSTLGDPGQVLHWQR